ncbi:hypothetical protein CANCADRAFT_101265 [Tortispora caseinolytica NRRL Y-17796]|uniref:Uncharacterized protein n=1 Tax=Tortispora caseinolytica NRRL Y-17796 TaxID=767744 RepID=A0A1E4TED0_9ASCO|nr:hypothetical protein CANCADRAFT_101265 [Tortispora caseinolytica NRRL Y-17796]
MTEDEFKTILCKSKDTGDMSNDEWVSIVNVLTQKLASRDDIDEIKKRLEFFRNSPPFTIQRIAELVLQDEIQSKYLPELFNVSSSMDDYREFKTHRIRSTNTP